VPSDLLQYKKSLETYSKKWVISERFGSRGAGNVVVPSPLRELLPFLMRQHQVGCLPNLVARGVPTKVLFSLGFSSSSFFFAPREAPSLVFANRVQRMDTT
jgi:hypothetical protein